MKKQNIVCILLAFISIQIMAQSTTVNCDAINNYVGAWKRSKFSELKGTLIGTNNDLKFSRYKMKTPLSGAITSEVIIYPEAPDFNTIELVMYQEATFTPTLSAQFDALYKSFKICMKDREENIMGGTKTGLVDGDNQMPEIEFDKDGMPVVTLIVEGPTMTENVYKIIIRIEASEDDE